jgi:hypothetical protein
MASGRGGYLPGDRVEWGEAVIWTGTLLERTTDPETGELEWCHDHGERVPLWRIRFDDGRIKERCCESLIVQKIGWKPMATRRSRGL